MPEGRHDLDRLAEELGVDSTHVLQLTEVAELVGFATTTRASRPRPRRPRRPGRTGWLDAVIRHR
jgi:hypothetical protein